MHAVISVLGPKTLDELNNVMFLFGPNVSPFKQVMGLDNLSDPGSLLVLLGYIKETLKRTDPYILLMPESEDGGECLEMVFDAGVDLALKYKDGTLKELVLMSRKDMIYDWFLVGGRWRGELRGVAGKELEDAVSDPIKELEDAVSDLAGMRLATQEKTSAEYKKEHKFTSLKVSDIDWGTMILENQRLYIDQWNVLNKYVKNAKPLSAFKNDEGGLMGRYDYPGFFAQTKDIPEKDRQLLWATSAILGLSKEEVVEYAELVTYTRSGLIHNGEWISSGGPFDERTVEQMRPIKERIVNNPDEVLTLVDIHY